MHAIPPQRHVNLAHVLPHSFRMFSRVIMVHDANTCSQCDVTHTVSLLSSCTIGVTCPLVHVGIAMDMRLIHGTLVSTAVASGLLKHAPLHVLGLPLDHAQAHAHLQPTTSKTHSKKASQRWVQGYASWICHGHYWLWQVCADLLGG